MNLSIVSLSITISSINLDTKLVKNDEILLIFDVTDQYLYMNIDEDEEKISYMKLIISR